MPSVIIVKQNGQETATVFAPVATGHNFTASGDAAKNEVAAQLRAYWKKYGALPFEERMMRVLTDPKSKFEAKREAAHNLGNLGERRTLTTTVFSNTVELGSAKKPNPALARFKTPTAAEAMLAAMDRDLAAFDNRAKKDRHDYEHRQIEDSYLEPLIALGDRRIAGELARRYRGNKELRLRRKLAVAAHLLGQGAPLREFAGEVATGKIKLPANDRPDTRKEDQPGNLAMAGIITSLSRADSPEAKRALHSIARARHPWHAYAVRQIIISGEYSPPWENPWRAHPFCLAILRRELEDTRLTGATHEIMGERVERRTDDWMSSDPLPDFLRDPAQRHAKVAERRCDRAAILITRSLMTAPRFIRCQKMPRRNWPASSKRSMPK